MPRPKAEKKAVVEEPQEVNPNPKGLPCDRCDQPWIYHACDIQQLLDDTGKLSWTTTDDPVRFGCAKHPVYWKKFFSDGTVRRGLGQ